MKKRYIPLIINSILSLTLLFLLINFSVAWFVDAKKEDLSLNGKSLGGYFAGGDGTKDNPYVIKTRFHMYNLAWLQYKGRFNGTSEADANALNKQFYFSVDNDIDMLGMIIPPIGTETYPFVGVFSGNGHTISNFSTTNDYSKLQTKPEDVTSINIPFVGMFGIIGNYNSLFNNVGASVDASKGIIFAATASNFYLHNYEVIIGTESSLSGVLAGYINASVSNIGLYYVHLNYLGKTNPLGASLSPNGSAYSLLSKYTLFGDYNTDTVDWGDNPGEQGYGKSFDINELYNRTSLLSTKGVIGKKEYLPLMGTGEKQTSVNGTYVGEAAAKNNIGYFVGANIKLTSDISKKNIVNDVFYSPYNSNGQFVNTDYIYTVDISKDDDLYLNTFGSEEFQNGDSIYDIRLQGAMQAWADGNTDRQTTIENAIYSGKQETITIPARSIWVKPVKAGTLRFVIVTQNNSNRFSLVRLYREAKTMTSEYKYSTVILEQGRLATTSSVQRVNDQTAPSDIKDKSYMAFCIEYAISQEDIDAGYEYVINNQDGSNGAYFWYMDLGQNGGSSSETEMGSIESVDFVYSTSFDFTNKSNVAFEISNTAGVIFYFKRNESSVLYYISNSSNGTATKKGSGSATSATDENCDN
mgnify:CR=1 FL=1